METYDDLDRDELLQRLVALEKEFNAYIGESKELEEFLEGEVERLTKQAQTLEDANKRLQDQLDAANGQNIELTRQIGVLDDEKRANASQLNEKVRALEKRLIDTEVLNDGLESKLRILESSRDDEDARLGELMERIALLDSDNLDKDQLIGQLQLQIQALQRENKSLAQQCDKYEKFSKLMTINRTELKVAKFQTPPINE
ncbi:hypothetical protein KL918_002306 [Ogataea parapolymorpha]|uniref:Uncharacterized protein n=1 Tax=Ogataea parapolymorpha (strain ATCC 26012 / BCRC 20466 / JCM 22074 / NRRL Y-7560 / DL-1) TaxID=871575 RepID=W1QJP1_OGAPD|nr:hypothetical protein HPODL_02232 [Ogataea parapolymorpha DL-1]ESX02918.1 hypothetical protein HPODL_02232 [Ogataea parapolymorpha DL-1]KAG7867709.1 hypothetical protein KL918_002306 [Ogataea parapolymorpha]KAG7869757.1 hypothetical protein KL916_005102 [Ogataea parapolymorpha]